MEESSEKAIMKYINKLCSKSTIDYFDQFFQGEALLELCNIVCGKYVEDSDFEINTFDNHSITEGFDIILNATSQYYLQEQKLKVTRNSMGIDMYELVNSQFKNQLYSVIKAVIGIIVKEGRDEWYEPIMELEPEEVKALQDLFQEIDTFLEEFPEATSDEVNNGVDSFNDEEDPHK